MSQILTIENRDYIPAGRVGKHFGYTRDYILTLAREGRIDGKKIGHRWYVNLESAEKYFDTAKIQREERKQIIQKERKTELRSFEQKRKSENKTSRLVEVLAIGLILMIIGVSGYVGFQGTNQQASIALSDTSFFKNFAVSLYNLISPEPVVLEEKVIVEQSKDQKDTELIPQNVSESKEITATKTIHTSLVIGPDEVLTTTRTESIRDSFSDDVSVSIDPHNPDTGIIIPHFKDKDGEAYRYLMVPVNENTN